MFTTAHAILVVIDIQGKLARVMHKQEELVSNTVKLIQAASLLDVPILVTEQVPEKIGPTVPEITSVLNGREVIAKPCFSCCGDEAFMNVLESTQRRQIIIAGIETHVCVYQTVSDLIQKKYELQVAADAVSSRVKENKDIALDRMRTLGSGITSTEMIICELLKTSTHARFKEVMGIIK